MATHAPITGAPARASVIPDLQPLDDTSAMLEAAEGALGFLAHELESYSRDVALTAHAIGYVVKAAKAEFRQLHIELARLRAGQLGGR